ncbi:MAG: hypothetical protein QM763_00395 [Agriterribacter sp.]
MSKKFPETTVIMTVNSQIGKAFNYIAPINLMHIFRGTALIPAIVDTSIKEGWNKAGLVRTIYFKDGSTSQESLLTMEEPQSFSYKNEHFTSRVLGFLLKRLEGEWLFTDLGNNKTKIEWTYRAIPTNAITGFFHQIFQEHFLSITVESISNPIKSCDNGALK